MEEVAKCLDIFRVAIESGFTFIEEESIEFGMNDYYYYKEISMDEDTYLFIVKDNTVYELYETDDWYTFKKIVNTIVNGTNEIDVSLYSVD